MNTVRLTVVIHSDFPLVEYETYPSPVLPRAQALADKWASHAHLDWLLGFETSVRMMLGAEDREVVWCFEKSKEHYGSTYGQVTVWSTRGQQWWATTPIRVTMGDEHGEGPWIVVSGSNQNSRMAVRTAPDRVHSFNGQLPGEAIREAWIAFQAREAFRQLVGQPPMGYAPTSMNMEEYFTTKK